ncbi:MAG: hypothetical protein JOZ08_23745 [Verrucomicrobia bacterium]|nr:hypothetical protein [Verrucomicrobiota bacterium]
MYKELAFPFLLTSLLLAGCAEPEPQVVVLPTGRRLAQSDAAPRTITPTGPIGTVANVRQSEQVKVYGVNRYVDPADPRIMHERHAIYRLEQKPAWVTRTKNQSGEILLGPILGLHPPEYAPEPLPGETARDLAEAKRGVQDASKDLQSMREGQQKLASNVQSLAEQTLDGQRKLTTAVGLLNERMKKLENQPAASPTPAADNNNVRTEPAGVVVRPGN